MHLGKGVSVRKEDVVLLADLTRPLGADTRRLLEALREKGQLRQLDPEPQTLALMHSEGRDWAVLTGVGLRTLRQRAADAGRW